MNRRNDEVEVDLGKLMQYYLRHWFALLASGIAMAVAAFLFTFFLITPQYRAGVTFYVTNTTDTQSIQSLTGTNLSTAQRLVNTYVNIIKSDSVLDQVVEKGNLDCTAGDIRGIMSASQIDDTEMFTVTIAHPNAKMAAHIANTIAEVAPPRISSLVKGSSTSIIDYAKIPQAPSSPSYSRNIILGVLLGGVLMAAVLTFRFLFDMRIKTEEDIAEYLRIPVLGSIPDLNSGEKDKHGAYSLDAVGGGQRS